MYTCCRLCTSTRPQELLWSVWMSCLLLLFEGWDRAVFNSSKLRFVEFSRGLAVGSSLMVFAGICIYKYIRYLQLCCPQSVHLCKTGLCLWNNNFGNWFSLSSVLQIQSDWPLQRRAIYLVTNYLKFSTYFRSMSSCERTFMNGVRMDVLYNLIYHLL